MVFGDSARDDEELSERLGALMSRANALPSDPPEELSAFEAAIERYVDSAEEGSLVGLFADAPADARTKPAGQVPHWFFATQDTLAINSLRALVLIASHPLQHARVREELGGGGDVEPLKAEQVGGLTYLEAAKEWTFNHFSHGPQGCPGAGLALFLGKALLAGVLLRSEPRVSQPALDPERPLPHLLDFFRVRVAL